MVEDFFNIEAAQFRKLGFFIAAPTGVGKTLCFMIPSLGVLDFSSPIFVSQVEKHFNYKSRKN